MGYGVSEWELKWRLVTNAISFKFDRYRFLATLVGSLVHRKGASNSYFSFLRQYFNALRSVETAAKLNFPPRENSASYSCLQHYFFAPILRIFASDVSTRNYRPVSDFGNVRRNVLENLELWLSQPGFEILGSHGYNWPIIILECVIWCLILYCD